MPDSRFLDFDLHISVEGKHFAAQVTQSPVGRSERVALRWPFREPVDVVLLRVEHAVLKSQLRGMRGGPVAADKLMQHGSPTGPMSVDEQVLRDFGACMFKAVFRSDPDIARRFNGSLDVANAQADKVAGLRVKLTIDPPELSALPWEYVFDDSMSDPLQSYLALRSRTPLVRFLPLGDLPTFARLEPPLRILGMIANPGAGGGSAWEPLDVDSERNRIEQAMNRVADPRRMKFRWVNGETPEDLERALAEDDWHVFHFIGHGGTDVFVENDGRSHSSAYLVLSDGLGGAVKVTASQLALRLQDSSRLRLAVLNCCEIGRHAGAVLMHGGLPSVVAMQFKISNDAAVRFASVFYGSLLAGKSVEKALTAARVNMQLHCGVEWATPVLFTRMGSDVLFEGAGDQVMIDPEQIQLPLGPQEPPLAPPVRSADPADPTTWRQLRPVTPVATAILSRKQQAQNELRRMFAGLGY